MDVNDVKLPLITNPLGACRECGFIGAVTGFTTTRSTLYWCMECWPKMPTVSALSLRISDSRRRAATINPHGKHDLTREQWAGILQQSGGNCAYCGMHIGFKALHLEHVVALTNGGDHTASNVAASCGRCNRLKGNRPRDYLLTVSSPVLEHRVVKLPVLTVEMGEYLAIKAAAKKRGMSVANFIRWCIATASGIPVREREMGGNRKENKEQEK